MATVLSYIKRIFCKHKNRTEIFRYYPDRCLIEECDSCGKEIWSDL